MFPSTLSTFNRPTASDRLNSPSHSALHNTVSSSLGQVEAFIGTLSSVQGTLMYDVRASASDGGGHVQTAVKGGTGQTTFTKGDILAASSPSVLSKLAVGADNLVLVANSSVATGITWGNPPGTKITTVATSIMSSNNEVSIFSATLPGSTLGSSNAVRATTYIDQYDLVGGSIFSVRAFYANNLIASITAISTANVNPNMSGSAEYVLIGKSSSSVQTGILKVMLMDQSNPAGVTSVVSLSMMGMGTTSVISDAPQQIGMTILTQSGVQARILGTVVERIL